MNTNTKYFELTASEFEWKLSEEKTVNAWGFNKSVPGPAITAKKGDTVIVKVKNELKEPTTIHWHGIRLPASMDGTDDVQKPVLPGQEFEYRFQVPDAGTFWYHSHVNETVQMERGMYGALIVKDDTDPMFDRERVLVIDDMKLTKQNSFKVGNLVTRWMERHDGREGETLLINGKEGFTIDMHEGQYERWRIINASSARYFRFYLGGRVFKIISTDGGLIEQAQTVTEILLTPGERVDIIAGGFTEGEEFAIESLPYNRMTFLKAKRQIFGMVKVQKSKPSVAYIPERLRNIEPLADQNADVTRKITLSVGPSLKHGIDFLVNKQVHAMDKPVNVGELQVWEIHNTSLMDHPYHLHGFFFQVLEENGKKPAYRAWKDTINVKPRSKVKIAWVPDNRPGNWMHHCHILEHHAAGMMAHFQVVDPKHPSLTPKHHAHAHHH